MSAVPAQGPSAAAEPALRCAGVRKVWNESTSRAMVAVETIDLDVADGEFVVLLGPSGCGKSSLLFMAAGLETPSDGTIHSHGTPVTVPGPDRSLIFQESSLYPWLTVWQNVTFGLRLQGMDVKRRRAVATELLREVGLADALDKRPAELSGGMRQRVAIARALSMQPRLLLMDEPFAALDVQTRSKLQDFLVQIWSGNKTSVLFVTHSIDEAVALADRIVVFTSRPGRIKTVVPVDLPRPRDVRDPAFHAIHDQLVDLMRDEVDRAFAQQEML